MCHLHAHHAPHCGMISCQTATDRPLHKCHIDLYGKFKFSCSGPVYSTRMHDKI